MRPFWFSWLPNMPRDERDLQLFENFSSFARHIRQHPDRVSDHVVADSPADAVRKVS